MKSSFLLPTIVVVLLRGCGGKTQQPPQGPPPPTPVTAVRALRGDATYYEEFPATITALREVEIQPQVAGAITGIFFRGGQRVRQGQRLFTIDTQPYRAGYDQAVANLNAQKANLNRAQRDADRYTTLAQQDAIARQVVDNASASLEAAKMQVAAAQAAVQQVATNLKYTTIYSPLDGVIGISEVGLGEAVAPGSMPLTIVSADHPVAADVQVSGADILRFVRLQQQPSNPRDSTLLLVLSDQSTYRQPGAVRTVDRAVDAQSGTLRVRVAFPNPDQALRVGLTGKLRVKNRTHQPQVLIPYQAVTEQMSEYFVFVVGDSNKVTQKKLTLGARLTDKVIVTSGLKGGELVVTEGTQKIRDGARVQVIN